MRKIVLLAAGVLAAMAMTAVPAGAAASSQSVSFCTGWEAAGSGSFDSLQALTAPSSSARGAGDVAKEPSLNETYEEMPASANGKAKNFRATVPVWFHVITPDGVTGNVSDAKIEEQITVLNLGFGGFYGGAKSGFTFKLAGITRTTNADWYAAKAGTNPERDMKRTLHRGGWETLNVYSSLAGGYLGYAYLPGLPESRQYIDGIVLRWQSMPKVSTAFEGRYDLGYTLIHEAGHWVNLEHTFFGGCNAKGDFVDDTPAMLVPSRGCPEGKDTCSDPGLDPIHNYMDYSDDPCYTEFTAGQVQRAQDSWLYFRAP
jgi:hypothetical protein